jgi:hypothetical protein
MFLLTLLPVSLYRQAGFVNDTEKRKTERDVRKVV